MRLSTIHAALSSVAIILAPPTANAQNPAAAQPQSPSMRQSGPARDEAVLAVLQDTIVDADYNRVDFEKVIQDLRDRFSLNIHVSWTNLETAGVRRDRRIEVQLKKISLATLLDIILREASSGTTGGPVSYHVDDGVIIISTGERAHEDTVLRTYDIADLIESGYAIRRFANTPVLGMNLTGREFVGGEERKEQAATFGTGGGTGGQRGSTITEGGEQPENITIMERVQQVIDLITENVEPESWSANGGDIGDVRSFGSMLLIRHTLRTHQRINEFLDLLRTSRPQPLDGDAAVLRLRADKASQWRREIGPGFPRMTAAQADKLTGSSAADGVLFRASTSGFNGHGMWFSALTQRDVLTGITPVVGDHTNGFAPQTGDSTAGLELIVLPLVAPKSTDVTVDVQMAWVPTTQVASRAVTLAPGMAEATIDQTQRTMRTVSSTTKLKLGDAIALSIPSQLSDQGSALEWEDWLIVRVHEPGT